MSDTIEFEQELRDIFKLFYDDPPTTFETIETSRSDTDFREVAISQLSSGEMAVIKLSDNTFTFPDKIKMWQRTIKEYHRLGYYSPTKTENFRQYDTRVTAALHTQRNTPPTDPPSTAQKTAPTWI